METHIVRCDICQRDITSSTNAIAWRIAVNNVRIPRLEGTAATLAMISPILKQNYDLCSWGCFREWAMQTFGLVKLEPNNPQQNSDEH